MKKNVSQPCSTSQSDCSLESCDHYVEIGNNFDRWWIKLSYVSWSWVNNNNGGWESQTVKPESSNKIIINL